MSDYVYAMKFSKNGCPQCGGESASNRKHRFRCEDCDFAFP